jgi:hypothetical protein
MAIVLLLMAEQLPSSWSAFGFGFTVAILLVWVQVFLAIY